MMPEAKRALHKKVVVRPRVASPDETPAIEAEGLTRQFGDFVAVDHVSFKIARGEIFGFLGSNGCGKSTTMKMLVGFLPATSGTCKLFGEPMGSNDMQARRNVGYMTQAFSLYGELTVAQNLELHAQLYHLPPEKVAGRIEELLERYDLKSVVNARPDSLPLGIKQRLQLAVAVLHEPSILILDEPTSGVDPIARDSFWRTLIDLSRDDGVTIFVTTHFMNEADRCDRISLMHAGKVLAVGAPQELVKERGSASLEDCFVGYLAEAAGIDMSKKVEAPAPTAAEVEAIERPKRFNIGRLWAYARRETVELLRDPIRLAFALVGPIILMFAFGYRHLVRHRELGRPRPSIRTTRPRAASCFRASTDRAISPSSPRSRRRRKWSGGSRAETPRSWSKCRPDSAATFSTTARRKSTRRSTAP